MKYTKHPGYPGPERRRTLCAVAWKSHLSCFIYGGIVMNNLVAVLFCAASIICATALFLTSIISPALIIVK